MHCIDAVSVSESSACDLDSCIPKNIVLSQSLKILNQNIRSISKNMPGLHTILARTKVNWDIITLTECWLRNSPKIPELTGYDCFATSKNHTQNEGVVVFVRKELKATVEEPTFSDANCILTKIDCKTVLISIYRPPGYKDITNFINSLDTLLANVSSYTNIIITGDININIHEHSHDTNKHTYLNLLASHGLLTAHTLPTRLSACLDHVLLKTQFPAVTHIAHSALTDHETVLLFLAKRATGKVLRKTVVKIDYVQLDADLEILDFSPVYNTQDVNKAAEIMTNLIINAVESNSNKVRVPNRKVIIKPWITPGLLRCMRHRDNLHKQLKKAPTNEILKLTFTRYRNYCNGLLRKIKSDYEKSQLFNAGKNIKQIWTVINDITNRTKKEDYVSNLLTLSNTPEASVNKINQYFAGVGKGLAEKITTAVETIEPTTTQSNCSQSMGMLPTDEDEITQLLTSLRDNCAVGYDGISSNLLKKHRAIVVPPLTYICNLALATGKFPNTFKKAIIHPIYKAGDRSRVSNYRPIAVLSSMSKILERILNKRLTKYLEENQLLSPSQYGFRSGKSTSDAVHDLTNHVVINLDAGQKVLGIFLDLAKAFDTISIPTLIKKMERMGIRGLQLKIFEDYLTERTQRVKVGEFLSDECTLTYGTPQGSVLGPTLFLIYINDLCMLSLPRGKIVAFADDTALLFSAGTWREVYTYAQSGFNMVSNWLKTNILTLNSDKTNFVNFRLKTEDKKRFPIPHSIVAHYCTTTSANFCTCASLANAEKIKYLGVIIDSNLRFQEHIHTLSSRLRKLIYIFKTLRHVADVNLLKTVYFALVQSLLTYCITSWGGASKTIMIELERAQRAVLKVSYFKSYRYPSSQLYKESKVLTVRQLFILNTLLKQHSLLTYCPSLTLQKRRYNPVGHRPRLSKMFSKHFFCHLGGFLYNRVNSSHEIYNLTKSACKKKLSIWLQDLNYDDTEKLLISPA